MEHECKNTSGQKLKLPFSAVLLYLVLAAVLLSGVTFSRYMTGTTVGDSARAAYMKGISISEEGNFTKPNEWIITPGVDMQKKATVKFDGSEMACYVFLEIKTVGWTRSGKYSYVCRTDGTDALAWNVDADAWEYLSGDGSGAVYYCIVIANKELVANVLANEGTITVREDLTRTQLGGLTADMSIDIEATAVQYHGFSEAADAGYTESGRAEAVWNVVKNR